MKWIGVSLLLAGFVWLGGEVFMFSAYQHARWWTLSGQLSAGDTIAKDEAIGAMRRLSLELNTRQREVIYPALLMLAGGLTAACRRKAPRPAPQKI